MKEKLKGWKQCADQSFWKGAGAAHKYTKIPAKAELIKTMFQAEPYKLVDREFSKWKEVWQHHGYAMLPTPPDIANWELLPDMSVAYLREA
eukprot:4699997-Pyramimonas_sp.AAC.1